MISIPLQQSQLGSVIAVDWFLPEILLKIILKLFKEMDLYKIITQHILGRVLEFLWVCKNYQLVAWPVLAKWISSFSWACLEIGFSSIHITANSWEYHVHIVEVKPCLGEMCLCLSKTCRNLNALNLWIRFDIKGHFVKSNWDFVKKKFNVGPFTISILISPKRIAKVIHKS